MNSLETIVIATHDKRFHVDDVGAVSLLASYFNTCDPNDHKLTVKIIRTRETTLLENADILVDVGGVYDPDHYRYDHHQVECNETFSFTVPGSTIIPMSSIGMVWKHHGQAILARYIESQSNFSSIENWTSHIPILYQEVYSKIIQEIDAHDNGIPMMEGGKRNYWSNLNLPSIISSLNTSNTNDEEAQMQAFRQAIELFGKIFEIKLSEIITKYFDYQTDLLTVKSLLEESSEEYLIINRRINTIFKCLNKLDPDYRVKFLIIREESETESSKEKEYTVKTRSRRETPYQPLIVLNSAERLKELFDDIIFVHKNGFIAKTKSLESALGIIQTAVQTVIQNTTHKQEECLKSVTPRQCPVLRNWIVTGGLLVIAGLTAGIFLSHPSNNST